LNVLLDTTVLIDCLRGRPVIERIKALRESGDVPCATAVNIEEIFRGLHKREERAARRLISGLRILSLDDRTGVMAGTWRREYARRGLTLAQADCLVAAAAVLSRATLATGNPKDFPMRELRLEHWPVGE
jgi:predicted nucleic acid-binding protein